MTSCHSGCWKQVTTNQNVSFTSTKGEMDRWRRIPLSGSVEDLDIVPPLNSLHESFKCTYMLYLHKFIDIQVPLFWFASSSRHNLEIGLTKVEAFVFTSAVRTKPSAPKNTLVTRSRCQCLLGWVVSTKSTGSFILKFGFFVIHFFLSCKRGRYSRIVSCACGLRTFRLLFHTHAFNRWFLASVHDIRQRSKNGDPSDHPTYWVT